MLLIRLESGADKTSESQSGALSCSSLSLSLSTSFSFSIAISSSAASVVFVGDSNLAISCASSSDNRADPCLIHYFHDSVLFLSII